MAGPSNELPITDLMENLMKDPIKRAMVLQLLSKEKDNIEKYKRQELKKQTTPLKTRKIHCESPTALQRRRALAQRTTDTSGSSSSELSEVTSEVKGPELPFGELLKGVTAYVEVKRQNEDRSEGIKAVMKLMGATIRDKFTNDVTHVIFKDGSFTTFEKAKLMKTHLVSVLWLDAVRRHNAQVPEKNYPAFGHRVCDANVSILCSQIQKDYEDVIKDERRRRHTMMTSRTSLSSYLTAQNVALSDDESNGKRVESPDLTSDDSNCGVVDGYASKPSKNSDLLVQTNPPNDVSENFESSGSTSLLSHINKNRRKTINVISNMVLTPNIKLYSQIRSSEKISKTTTVPDENKLKNVLQNSTFQSSTMSSLRVSTQSDKTKSDLANSKESDKTRSDLTNSKESNKTKSSLVTDKENCNVAATDTTMSSLRLSDDSFHKSNEERARTRSATKLTPTPSKEKQTASSVSSSTSTDKVTVRVRKTRRTKSPQSKELNDGRSSESEDQSPKNKISPKSKRKTVGVSKSQESPSDLLKELDQLNTDILNSTRATPKQNNKTKRTPASAKSKDISSRLSPSKSVQTLNSEESDVEEQSKKMGTLRRSRRTTSFIPQTQTQQTPTRSRRSTSVLSTISFDVTRSRRSSRLRTSLDTEAKETSIESNEPEFVRPKNVRKTKRATSVVSSRSDQSSNDGRRSISEDTISMEASVVSTRADAELSENTKNKKIAEITPSPKKARVEVKSSTKRRKLYNPDDGITFTPPAEEEERQEYVKQKSQKSPEDLFVNPNNINIVPLPTQPKPNNLILNSDPNDSSNDDSEVEEPKKTTKRGAKNNRQPKTPQKRNSANDEQKELLDLLNRAIGSPRHNSERICLTQTKPKYTFSSTSSGTLSTSSLPISPLKRRSTLDFVSITQSQQKPKLKLDSKRKTSIVCTKMHREEVNKFESTVSNLGRYFVEDKVTGRTSHLVAAESKRTINMLRAIARGCWIVKQEWLLKSEEAGKWLDEEDYELTDFSPAVQQCRLQKEAFGPLYSMDIFKDCGYIYVGKATSPKTADLKELISICKGKVTNVYRNASIVIGEYINRDGIKCVTEMWVLDSICFNRLKGFKDYLLKPGSPHV